MNTRSTFSTQTPRPRRRLRLLAVAALLAGAMTIAGTTSGLLTSPAAATGSCDTSAPGNGSPSTPFIVTTSAQLASLNVTGSAGVYYWQCSNLDLESCTNWAGVGGTETAFGGVYDGNGYTISNVSIAASGDNYWG